MGYPLPLDRIDTLKTDRFARLGEMGVLNAGPEAEWSVHGVADAHNYTFVWGKGGENLDYGDKEFFGITNLRLQFAKLY